MNVLTPLRKFFAPPPPAARLSEQDMFRRVYGAYRWRALEATFLGYAFYYLVRGNTVSVVTLEMHESLHYSKEMIGTIAAVTCASRTASANS